MTQEKMIDEEKANTDKLEFYFNEKFNVHIILKREVSPGRKSWLNGTIIERPTDRLWILNEQKLGEVRLSISEIAPDGVKEFREARR